jgi:hypothetical protein
VRNAVLRKTHGLRARAANTLERDEKAPDCDVPTSHPRRFSGQAVR